MNRQPGVLLVAIAALGCGLAFSQNPPAQDPAVGRVEKLDQDLAATRLRIEALAARVAEHDKKLEAIVKYLDAQAKSAAAMAAVLDQSETAGFTYGINPNSRHILLRGWREQLAAVQEGAPIPEPPPPPPPATPPKGARQ